MKSRLKEILNERGMTQAHVVRKVGVNKSTMTRLVNEETLPTLPVAYRIAKLLELHIDEIWYDEEA